MSKHIYVHFDKPNIWYEIMNFWFQHVQCRFIMYSKTKLLFIITHKNDEYSNETIVFGKTLSRLILSTRCHVCC